MKLVERTVSVYVMCSECRYNQLHCMQRTNSVCFLMLNSSCFFTELPAKRWRHSGGCLCSHKACASTRGHEAVQYGSHSSSDERKPRTIWLQRKVFVFWTDSSALASTTTPATSSCIQKDCGRRGKSRQRGIGRRGSSQTASIGNLGDNV